MKQKCRQHKISYMGILLSPKRPAIEVIKQSTTIFHGSSEAY